MKVTVCFGQTKVVVPCGNGDITVGHLQEKACVRYRRAIGKNASYEVKINKLENAVDGGILDVEDLVVDVVEDKDKLIAIYAEESPRNFGLDDLSVTSSEEKNSSFYSSLNTTRLDGSNDLEQRYLSVDNHSSSAKKNSSFETTINGESTYNGTSDVRNNMLKMSPQPLAKNAETQIYRFKPNDVSRSTTSPRESNYSKSHLSDSVHSVSTDTPKKITSPRSQPPYFQQDGDSRQIAGDKRALSPAIQETTYTSPDSIQAKQADDDMQLSLTVWLYENSREKCFINNGDIEAIKVREYLASEKGIFVGLLVQSIKPKSSVSLEFPFNLGDVIIGINEHLLLDFDFNDAESLLTQSLSRSQVRFRVFTPKNKQASSPRSLNPDDSVVDQKMKSATSRDSSKSTSPSKRTPSKHCTSPVHVPVSLARKSSRDLKKLTIPITVDLVKGNNGLGFSLASKDLILGEPGPIYIQQISKDGAAMKSGKLLIGDRLLEVNRQSTTGKTQEQIVNALRAVDLGGVVSITVGRLAHNFPRKLKVQSADANLKISDEQEKEYLTLDIALNDTGSAGLGISLKGNSDTKTGEDFGIFVRSVLHGGAAWQDGRLQANDQLIEINGQSLCGISNQVAIDIVRTSMSNEVRGMIEVVVCRRKFDLETSRMSSDASSDMSELFLNRDKNLSSSDFLYHRLTKQASLPSLLLETSFGADNLSDVTSGTFNASTLGRPRKKSKARNPYDPVQTRSPISELDTLDVESVTQAQQKIFGSSSSSSNMIGTWLESVSDLNRPNPTNSAYATWTIPRTRRVPKRTLSGQRSGMKRADSVDTSLDDSFEPTGDLQRGEFDEMTAQHVTSVSHLPRATSVTESFHHDKNLDKSENDKNKVNKNESRNEAASDVVRRSLYRNLDSFGNQSNRASIRRSQSIDSLTPVTNQSNQETEPAAQSRDTPKSDVGPCLGIAKSSSLESLQTAVEACNAEKNQDQPLARPLPKSVRGRVLNDSFRAALNRSYDLSQTIPALKQMETASTKSVQEDGRINIKSSGKTSEENVKPYKKKKRFLSLFKSNKTKKQEIEATVINTMLTEKEEHRRTLEAKKEEDFARMKEERERIETKAKEMREKRAEERKKENASRDTGLSSMSSSADIAMERSPSVPVTSMQKSRDFYLKSPPLTDDAFTSSSIDRTNLDESRNASELTSPRKNRKRSKSENRKFKDSTAAYNSLPRPTRQAHQSPRDSDSLETSDTSYVHKIDNINFYNRHKPAAPTSKRAPKEQSRNGRIVNNNKHESVLSSDRKSMPEHKDKNHRRVKTHDPQKYLTLQNGTSASFALRWKDPTLRSKQPSNVRHSVYTDQPSAFANYPTPHTYGAPITRKTDSISRRSPANDSMWRPNRTKQDSSSSSNESNQTASSSGLGVSERNRHDKSPMSMPTNL